jgi:AcrR family transcriptional regulator
VHSQDTRIALLDAAEQIVARDGTGALSVRRVAAEIGTTTRAVYSLYGSKEGLVAALGEHAFDLLGTRVGALPMSDDPAADLVQAGMEFGRFAREHTALFRIGVQRADVPPETRQAFAAAADRALTVLKERIGRLGDVGQLGDRTIGDATWEFHALCEGLAALEMRGSLPVATYERLWESALSALVRGWST